jgi:hypothetical protein
MEWIFLKYSLLFFTIFFFDLEEIIFENVNISENNIINQGTRVCKYMHTYAHFIMYSTYLASLSWRHVVQRLVVPNCECSPIN